ncbi:hypothetical protein [Microcystis phage Mwe-JY25]
MSDASRLQEKVDALAGERGKAMRPRAAVRIEDLSALLDIAPRVNAEPAAGATPTKAEYDALRREVVDLRRGLAAVAEALRLRLR